MQTSLPPPPRPAVEINVKDEEVDDDDAVRDLVVEPVDDLADPEDDPAGVLVQPGTQPHLLLVACLSVFGPEGKEQ